jgi:hypothetical protein
MKGSVMLSHSHLIGLTLVAACGASTVTEQPGPRGLRADQHLATASREDARAEELTTWPEQRAGANSAVQPPVSPTWYGTWDTVAEHRKRAAYHRSAAADLEADYEAACGQTPAAIAAVSPLQQYGIGGNPTANGTVVILRPEAGPPEHLLQQLRCHRAWMMLGRADMGQCPLDLPGLHVDARGDATAIELTLTVDNPKLVPELQRRAAHDLEAAAHTKHDAQ